MASTKEGKRKKPKIKGSKKEKSEESDNSEKTEKKKKKKKDKDKIKGKAKKKEVKLLIVKSGKANPKDPIDPRTGTRFHPDTARQLAFEIIAKMASDGKNTRDIRTKLKDSRKENGCKYNMDSGYLNYVVATHPEFFECYSDGKINVLKKAKPDKALAKSMEDAANKKKKRANDEREKRKKKGNKKDKSKGKKGKKKPKIK